MNLLNIIKALISNNINIKCSLLTGDLHIDLTELNKKENMRYIKRINKQYSIYIDNLILSIENIFFTYYGIEKDTFYIFYSNKNIHYEWVAVISFPNYTILNRLYVLKNIIK